ncbi:MAG: thermonuclease family protein [Alphaproteobacteria bacterium]
MWRVVPVLLIAAIGALPAHGAGLADGGTARVVAVVDGDTVTLDSGAAVRLVGIQAPKLPLGRSGFTPWPLAAEAKDALEALALGRRVRLGYGGTRIDRYGRRLAHLHRDDGVWLQGAMLRAGLARVYSFRDNRALVADMLALEREARAAGRGIWADPFYAVRRADAPRRLPDESFEIVEGRVVAAARVKGRVYLNFGADWRNDFTVSVGPRDRRLFEREGVDLMALEGRTIRVRGWIKWRNGPMIEISHPEQMEMVQK